MKSTHMLFIFGIVMLFATLISSCGNSGGNTNIENNYLNQILTIDNTGVIPVFDQTYTTTNIYVHNNSNNTLTTIKYQVNSDNPSSIINPISINTTQCTSLAAGESCALEITTPIVNDLILQGAFSITAIYNVNGIQRNFTQLVNYQKINQSTNNGVVFSSGVVISGYGNSTGYATLYLYSNHSQESYIINNLLIDKPAITITQGNISGESLIAGSIRAVEVGSAIPESAAIDAAITVTSEPFMTDSPASSTNSKSWRAKEQSESIQYIDSRNIIVYPSSAKAFLKAGMIPIINTAVGSSGKLILQNAGNQDAIVDSVDSESGIAYLSGCNGQAIPSGGSCTISFQVIGSSGHADIKINYSGGVTTSLVENVIWINSNDYALVNVVINDEPLSFPATTTGSTEVTISNTGKYNLNNITVSVPQVLTGTATASISENSCVGNLEIGQSCSYTINVSDNETELNKQIKLGFSGSFGENQTLFQPTILNYDSTDYAAIISISPNLDLVVTGDNYDFQNGVLIVSNNGNVSAQITGGILKNNPSYLTAISSCNGELEAGTSCNINVKLGPVFNVSTQSGTALYEISYSAAGQSSAGMVNSDISWLVNGGSFVFTTLSGNGDFNCALGNDQAAYCWGKGLAGQIGNETNQNVNIPTHVIMPSSVNFTKLSSNASFSCALGDNYAAYCWGIGESGQIGNGHNQSVNIPTMVKMPGGMKFAQISTNPSFSCALTRSGRAFCWGDSTNGHIGNGTDKNVKNTPKEVTMPGDVRFTQVSTNMNFSCALGNDSATYCWGYGESGQIGNGQNQTQEIPVKVTIPTGISFNQISTNENYSCALGSDTAIYCWGYGLYGQLGNGNTGVSNIPVKVSMPIGINFSFVETNDDFSCALSTMGTVYCWGYGAAGRIGNGSINNVSIPTRVTMPSGITFSQLSVGFNSSCALGNNKVSYCWGGGSNGKIGNGLNQNVSIPTQSIMPEGVSFYKLLVSQYLSCAISTVGKIYCWGGGLYGRVGNGANVDVNIPTEVVMPF